jgi:hypothetical protein
MDAGAKPKIDGTTRMRILETRQLRLSLHGLLEALLALDRQKNGWVWRATDHQLTVDDNGEGSVTVQARRDASSEPQRMTFDCAFVAAAVIHFCFLMRVPLPRNAHKDIEVTADGAALKITQTIEGPSLSISVRPGPSSGAKRPTRS